LQYPEGSKEDRLFVFQSHTTGHNASGKTKTKQKNKFVNSMQTTTKKKQDMQNKELRRIYFVL